MNLGVLWYILSSYCETLKLCIFLTVDSDQHQQSISRQQHLVAKEEEEEEKDQRISGIQVLGFVECEEKGCDEHIQGVCF
ncbi:hypothetical protein LINPERHAP1_LOCUS20872 [Linum perenne]